MAFDNRKAWGIVMSPGFAVGDLTDFAALKVILFFYFSCEASTGGVERALAVVKNRCEIHINSGDSGDSIWDSVEISLNGPSSESILFERHIVPKADGATNNEKCVHLLLTDFSRKLAKTWLARHGRRFKLYKRRVDHNIKRDQKIGSESMLVTKHKTALSHLSARKGQDKKLLGKPAHSFRQDPRKRLRNSPVWNLQLSKQHRLTQRRSAQRSRAAQGKKPFVPFPKRPGGIFGADAAGSSKSKKTTLRTLLAEKLIQSKLSILNASKKSMLKSNHAKGVTQWDGSASGKPSMWLQQLKCADLVILDSVEELHSAHARGTHAVLVKYQVPIKVLCFFINYTMGKPQPNLKCKHSEDGLCEVCRLFGGFGQAGL